MINEIETAIKTLAEKTKGEANPIKAQQLSQAALNLAHARAAVIVNPKPVGEGNS